MIHRKSSTTNFNFVDDDKWNTRSELETRGTQELNCWTAGINLSVVRVPYKGKFNPKLVLSRCMPPSYSFRSQSTFLSGVIEQMNEYRENFNEPTSIEKEHI